MSPYNVVSAVASVTLAGLNFVASDTTVTAAVALADCGTASWTTATSVSCIGTRGAGEVGTAGVTVGGVTGTSSVVFSFDGGGRFLVFQTSVFCFGLTEMLHGRGGAVKPIRGFSRHF